MAEIKEPEELREEELEEIAGGFGVKTIYTYDSGDTFQSGNHAYVVLSSDDSRVNCNRYRYSSPLDGWIIDQYETLSNDYLASGWQYLGKNALKIAEEKRSEIKIKTPLDPR